MLIVRALFFPCGSYKWIMNFTLSQYSEKVLPFVTVALQKLLVSFQSMMFVFVCDTACTHFTVFKLFNNEAGTFLEYSNKFCDSLLRYSVVILYELSVSLRFLSSGLVIGLSIYFSSTIMVFPSLQSRFFSYP